MKCGVTIYHSVKRKPLSCPDGSYCIIALVDEFGGHTRDTSPHLNGEEIPATQNIRLKIGYRKVHGDTHHG